MMGDSSNGSVTYDPMTVDFDQSVPSEAYIPPADDCSLPSLSWLLGVNPGVKDSCHQSTANSHHHSHHHHTGVTSHSTICKPCPNTQQQTTTQQTTSIGAADDNSNSSGSNNTVARVFPSVYDAAAQQDEFTSSTSGLVQAGAVVHEDHPMLTDSSVLSSPASSPQPPMSSQSMSPSPPSPHLQGGVACTPSTSTAGVDNDVFLSADDSAGHMYSVAAAPQAKKQSVESEEAPNPYPKPVYSFPCLIGLAMRNSADGKLAVSQIYEYICEHFPYYRTAKSGWKNSIRHNLSLNKFFCKVERDVSSGEDAGAKGSLWTVVENTHDALDRDIANCLTKRRRGSKRAGSNSSMRSLSRMSSTSPSPSPMGTPTPGAAAATPGKKTPSPSPPPAMMMPTTCGGSSSAMVSSAEYLSNLMSSSSTSSTADVGGGYGSGGSDPYLYGDGGCIGASSQQMSYGSSSHHIGSHHSSSHHSMTSGSYMVPAPGSDAWMETLDRPNGIAELADGLGMDINFASYLTDDALVVDQKFIDAFDASEL